VEFAPAPGSIRCNVWIGGKRFRDIRLVWDDPTARCYCASRLVRAVSA